MRYNFAALAAVFLTSGSFLLQAQQLPVAAPSAEEQRNASPAPSVSHVPPEISPAPSVAASPLSPAKTAAVPIVKISPSPSPGKTQGAATGADGMSLSDVHEVIDLLKSNYLDPDALTETALARATLRGLLDKPGVALLPGDTAPDEPSPLRTEILGDSVGYVRLGTISKAGVDQLDAALQGFSDKALKSAILDLRATPPSSDFAVAAQVIERFVPKDKLLFTIQKPVDKQEQTFTSGENQHFKGLLVALVDKETAGAAEVIAAVLRIRANALVVGEKTRGEAVEFAELPLKDGQILRVGVGKVVLPEKHSIFPDGVKPDLVVGVPEEAELEVLKDEVDGGAAKFVFETERAKMNEASLVAGTNPELDAMEAAQHAKERPKTPWRDIILQRGVDVLTSISIYENAGK